MQCTLYAGRVVSVITERRHCYRNDSRNPMSSLSLYRNLHVATETLFSQKIRELDYVIFSHKLVLLDAGREQDARAACHPEKFRHHSFGMSADPAKPATTS